MDEWEKKFLLFLHGFSQTNVWCVQVWVNKRPNRHKHLSIIFFHCKHDFGLIIMSSLKIVWSKHFHLLWQVASVTAELSSSLNFYQNTQLWGSLFLKRKDGRDFARKNDCSDTSYLRCNSGPFVAVNRGDTRSGEIENIFYDILGKKKPTTGAFKLFFSNLW